MVYSLTFMKKALSILLLLLVILVQQGQAQNKLYSVANTSIAGTTNGEIIIIEINTGTGAVDTIFEGKVSDYPVSSNDLFDINEQGTNFYMRVPGTNFNLTEDSLLIVDVNSTKIKKVAPPDSIDLYQGLYNCKLESFYLIKGNSSTSNNRILFSLDTATNSVVSLYDSISGVFTNTNFLSAKEQLIYIAYPPYIYTIDVNGSLINKSNTTLFQNGLSRLKFSCTTNKLYATEMASSYIQEYNPLNGQLLQTITHPFQDISVIDVTGNLVYIIPTENFQTTKELHTYNLSTGQFEDVVELQIDDVSTIFRMLSPYRCGSVANFRSQPDCSTPRKTNFTFTGSAGDFRWDFGVAGSQADTSRAVNPSFTFPAAGSYNVRLITIGCVTPDTFDTVVVVPPLPPLPSFSLPDTVVLNCQLDTITLEPLNDQGGTFYKWSTGKTTRTIKTNTPGLYHLRYENAVCSAWDTVIVMPPPTGGSVFLDTLQPCKTQGVFWRFQDVAPGGLFESFGTAVGGCQDTFRLRSIPQLPVRFDTITAACGSYNFGGQILTQSGDYTDTLLLAPQSVCDTVIRLNITVTPADTTNLTASICEADLPYNFNGELIINDGQFRDTLQNRFGCDSLVVLDLTINPLDTTNLTAVVCSNVLPYFFSGQLLVVSGQFRDTLQNSFGCDSLVILDLTVNPLDTTNLTAVVCSNVLPYVFGNRNLTASGVYADTLQNSFGCDSLVILDLVVNPTDITNLAVSVCGDALPYNFNGQLIMKSGEFRDTLTNQLGCDSLVVLDFLIQDDLISLTRVVCEDTLPYNFNGQLIMNSGQFSDTLTNQFGCDSIVVLDLIVNPLDTINISQTICDDTLPYLFGNQFLTASGSFSNRLTNDFGCDSLVNLNLTINPTYNIIIDTVLTNAVIRLGNRELDRSGSYTERLTTRAGCDSTVTVNLEITDELFVPNVITPNGDNMNDVLEIRDISFFAPVQLKIYNRWGTLVYETDDYQNDWDGENLAAGSYFIWLRTARGQEYKSWLMVSY